MRVLVLTKRRTSGKDLLDERFGRVYELTRWMAVDGHEIRGIALGYRGEQEISEQCPDPGLPTFQWQAQSIPRATPWQILPRLRSAAASAEPQVLWCSGDAIQALLARYLSDRLKLPLVIDLYDNYEAFWITRIPGLLQAFRRAVRHAEGVTCVSAPLDEMIRSAYRRSGPTLVIENGVNPGAFDTVSRREARTSFGLDPRSLLIGTAGSLRERSGISTLLEAYDRVRTVHSNARLVLAGPLDAGASPPSGAGITYLGTLPHERMPFLFRALDIAVVCNRNTRFGRYCYPLKLPEIVAAGIPVAVPDLPVLRGLVGAGSVPLYEPEDSASLASTLLDLAAGKGPAFPTPRSWQALSSSLTGFLGERCQDSR